MKRFLRKVGLLTAAVMMMSSGAAYGGNEAEANFGWVREVPTADHATFSSRESSSLKRHQTLYWSIREHDGDLKVINTTTGLEEICTVGGDPSCASAPLFISATSALICADSDIEGLTDGGFVAVMKLCSDKTCADFTSVQLGGSLNPLAIGGCAEFGGAAAQYDGFNTGGSWVYIYTSTPPVADGTSLVWITGI
jgi:hypothetical protein